MQLGWFEWLLFGAIVVLTVACGYYWYQQRRANILLYAAELDLERLSPYSRIPEVEAEVSRLMSAAEVDRDAILAEAQAMRDSVAASKKMVLEHLASQQSASGKTADALIEQARAEARRIAGDAIDAKERAHEFRALRDAMKNAIEGYGDEYIIPNHTVIDDLADEFDHKDAGERLKAARTATRTALRNQKAADCDYAERRRRETAIHFVIDAFNGKVESTLLKGKRGNYGKLRQEIEDAFAIVNRHGEAFKNARITDTYKQLRLSELKWVIATEELKIQEREEQREIKAQMREEEGARREYEKAIKEAAKEERLLEQAMAKARKELEVANASEKARYEEQLADLERKWREAESNNQRAISMAQQTKRGHVYIISNIGSFGHDVFKVGMTRRLEPLDRIRELGDASVPFDFDVHAMIYSEDAPRLENELHKRFDAERMNKVNIRREFFRVNLTDLKNVIDRLGIETHWTMFAEAAQYRESLAEAQKKKGDGGIKKSPLRPAFRN